MEPCTSSKISASSQSMLEWLQENGQAPVEEGNDHVYYDDWFNAESSGKF